MHLLSMSNEVVGPHMVMDHDHVGPTSPLLVHGRIWAPWIRQLLYGPRLYRTSAIVKIVYASGPTLLVKWPQLAPQRSKVDVKQ